MLNRCESRQRNYRELCNRSSTSSRGMDVCTRMQHNCDMLEDYWEDASVSIRSCHSFEATSPWVGGITSSAYEETDGEDDSKRFYGSGCRPYKHSFDANEYVTSLKGRRSFPPPLASCSTLSIKEGGRFVLKEMDADRPQGFFRAQRGNGRFRLELILPDEANDEEDSHVEDMRECVESGHVECGEQTITGSHEDCSSGDKDGMGSHFSGKVGSCESFDSSEGLWDEGLVYKLEDVETVRPTLKNVVLDTNECSTSQAIGMDVRHVDFDKSVPAQQVGVENSEAEEETRPPLDGFFSDEPHRDIFNCGKEAGFVEVDSFLTANFFALSKLELDQFVGDSSDSNVEQEPLWNVDGRNQALASLSPWSAKQIYLHQSSARMRPALGLAMS